MKNLPFEIDVYGHYPPGMVRMNWLDQPAPAMPEIDRLVAQVWQEQVDIAKREGRRLFNGQLARYLRHRSCEKSLVIDVGPTDYATFMATNLFNPHRAAELGWENFSNPMGTSATIITSDGHLIYGRRGTNVAFHQGYVHTIGGGVEANEVDTDGRIDVFASIRREINEEIAIAPEAIRELTCLGLIYDRHIRQPALIFDAIVAHSREELIHRIDAGDPEEEHEEFVSCADQPDAILRFIKQTNKIAPIAIGAALLHGRRRFGEEWFRETSQAISM